MAVCYKCGWKHNKKDYCPHCEAEVEYWCWECKSYIDPKVEEQCPSCGWFVCPECGKCGCDPDRPESLEERGEGWDEDDDTNAGFY